MISLDARFYANLEQEENCVARPCGISGSLDPIGVLLKMQAMLPSISTSSLDEESGRFWAAESSVLASYDAQVKNKTYYVWILSRPQTAVHRFVWFAHHPARRQNCRDGGPRGLLVTVCQYRVVPQKVRRCSTSTNFDLFCFGSMGLWTFPCWSQSWDLDLLKLFGLNGVFVQGMMESSQSPGPELRTGVKQDLLLLLLYYIYIYF